MTEKAFTFPKDFKWGSAVWAQGTEGAFDEDQKSKTVFEEYALQNPSRMQQGIGPFHTLDWYNRYEDYISYMEELHLNSFRTSISWARLMPDGRNVNQKAVDYYTSMFKNMAQKNMDVWVVLYWFDMPLHFEKQGGFSNRDIIPLFKDYVSVCFELFSEYVDIWFVYNEPAVDIMLKYFNDRCYPNEINFNKAYQSMYNMVVAHAEVVKEFKRLNIDSCKIGSVLDIKPVYPRSFHEKDVEAAEIFSLLHDKSWLSSFIHGVFPEELKEFLRGLNALPRMEKHDEALLKENTIQVLGINHYFPVRVQAKQHLRNPEAPLQPESFFDYYDMPGRKMNKYRGWEMYPKAIYDVLIDIRDHYNNIECYITENGIGVQNEERFKNKEGVIQDDYRIDYVRDYLEQCYYAIQEGCQLKGYHMWSFIDLWSPTNQFLNRYGFVEFHPETRETRIKKSGHWFKDVIDQNGFKKRNSD
ncbi:glycoside hydrolase family 1 protein [Salibacterium aidingense]|uniref:glycoside hydrolase family 1 protein n=1 Tax=Salibacterium aidingense TaxID=384933 RepID=UPI000404FD5A|nr:glycoside hydrolase family 1 protein [Salibacterium aidingense]